jgi:hypothetical protein
MKFKIGFIVVAILALVQVVVYGYIVKGTIETVEQDNSQLERQISSQRAQVNQLRQEVQRLEKMVAKVPPDFLAEYEDPESGFMEFLNFINAPLIKQDNVKVSMRRSPSFKSQPIPHFESGFSFSFSFLQNQEAEKVLNFLMHQNQFPLKLKTLNLKGSGKEKVNADLNISLLIPARHSQSLADIYREVQ